VPGAASEPVRSVPVEERRARLAVRHHLADGARATSVEQVAADLVALHGTDPASVHLACAARMPGVKTDDVAAALYERRTLLRMLGMRRTMFVVPTIAAPIVQHSSTDAVAARLRRQLVQHLSAVIPDAGRWLDDVGESVVAVLRDRGEASGVDLAAAEPRLRTTLTYAEGKAYGGQVAITTRVLGQLAAEGRIVRGRPSGGWTSSRYVWSPIERWLPAGLPRIPADRARVQLLRAWLSRFGPATEGDVVWWTGWNRGDARRALAEIDVLAVDLDGRLGLLLADDIDVVPAPEPWIALLPALDPTAMGWSERGWYLDDADRASLFDGSGNIGPSIWADGRIVGGWGQRPDGEVVWRLLHDIGVEATESVADQAAQLTAWHGGVRVVPRFRTPLERELAQS
jgi:hypothetical protein